MSALEKLKEKLRAKPRIDESPVKHVDVHVRQPKERKDKKQQDDLEEDKPKLFAYLRKIGRDDMVKEVVNDKSLSSFARQEIEGGKVVPEFIKYYLKNVVKFYPAKQ